MKRFFTTIIITFLVYLSLFTKTANANWFDDTWGNVKYYFTSLFSSYIAPKYDITLTSNQIDTNYNSENPQGIAKRAIPSELDEEMKINYVKSYIKGIYDRNAILSKCNGYEITLEDLIYYEVVNNKILLEASEINKVKSEFSPPDTNIPSSCFDDTWSKLQNVPIVFNKKEITDNNSVQGNQVIKETIPRASQVNDIDPDSPPSFEIQKDTGVHTDLMYMNLIPQSAMPTSADERRILFTQLMWPASQQKK